MADWPLTPEKSIFPSVTKARDYVTDHLSPSFWGNVETGILCFSPAVAGWAAEKFKGRGKRALGAKFYFFESSKTLLVSQFGIGAPSAVVQLEYLKVFSVRRVFSLGLAGGLSGKTAIGTGVFIQEAFRDEGCSYHYRPPSLSVTNPYGAEGEKLARRLQLTSVKSWTTDAPFRETKRELKKWAKKGLSCVEMEASALMAVADYHSLPLFCVAVISDIMEKEGWRRGFSDVLVKKRLQSLLSALLLHTDSV